MPEDTSKSEPAADANSPQNSGIPEEAHYVLPKNLCNSVRHLSDRDLELLLRACATESKHRTSTMTESSAKSAPRQSETAGPVALTRAQVGAVQAAFRAGVKPAVIARQFRLSQAQIREALSLKVVAD